MAAESVTPILVVDDDAGQRSLFESFLAHLGYDVQTASSGEDALVRLRESPPAMLISDVRMPGISGLELLAEAQKLVPGLPVLLVTAYADVRDAVGAIRTGAVEYLEKPIDLEELLACVRKATGESGGKGQLEAASLALPEEVIAESGAMHAVFDEVGLVAQSEVRVLITGESGAGKEVVADVIHRWSPRAHNTLVKVNCAAIPENLLESELFGHEKGAFTGAIARRTGRFEEADGGTIFLDEIGEMSPALQAKLLRITQDGTFNRVGSNDELSTDVRLIAATNRNLEAEVELGRFREDLYYRLNVMEIHVPPLRDRKADIGPLAKSFAARFSKGKPRFSPTALKCLEHYAWPGNVRELRNAMERATLLARGDVILPEHLPRKVQACDEAAEGGPEVATDASAAAGRMEDIERNAILEALKQNNYNRTETARALGISRRALTYKLRTYRDQGYSVDPE